MKYYCILIATTLLLYSCGLNNVEIKGKKRVNEISLNATLFMVDPDIMGTTVVISHDSLVVMYNSRSSPACELCKIIEDSIIKLGEFVDIGNGPFETNNSILIFDRDNLKLYIHSADMYKTIYSVNFSPDSILNVSTWKKMSMTIMDETSWSCQDKSSQSIDGNSFMVIGGRIGETNMLSVLFEDEMIELKNYTFPRDGFTGNNAVKRIGYNSARIFKQNGGNRYVYINNYGEHVDILLFNNRQIEKVINVYADYPKYTSKDGINCKYDIAKTKNGFYGDATSKYIYLLESPYPSMKKWLDSYKLKLGRYPNYTRSKIRVHDWDGNLVKILNLNIPVFSFVVSENDEYIYATSSDLEEGSEMIIRYSLK